MVVCGKIRGDDFIIRGEYMQISKTNIVLLFISVFIIGLLGTYYGTKITETEVLETNQSQINTQSIDNIDKVEQAYSLIEQHYIEDVEGDELIEGAIQGMLNTLDDPYSTYMNEQATENFNEQIESSFQGIGTEVSMVDGKVTIIAPIKDSPAEKAGLKPNDQIIKVDDEKLEGLDLTEAVEKIRGEAGSKVKLSITRGENNFEVELTRDDIPVETVYASTKDIDGKRTGIIEITSFSEDTSTDFKKELTKFEETEIDGLIIDVRGNPGGLLDSVEDMLMEFIPKNTPYLQIEDSEGEKELFYSELANKKEYPISVLIDEGSASASEILAVALKEVGYNVIGTKSFGKGTVQQAVPLGKDGMIKLTFFKWLSPEGNWIHEKGVKPTKEVKQPDYYYSHPIQVEKPFKLDQSDENIKTSQIMLDGLGYKIERKDGYFDHQTALSIEKFQKKHSLKVTGELDKQTANTLELEIMQRIKDGKDDLQMKAALESLYK